MSLDRDMSVKLARRVSQVVFLPLSSQWKTKDRAVPWLTSNRNGHCIQSKPWEAWIYSLKGSGTSEWAQAQYPLIPSLTIRLADLPGYSLFPRAPCWLPSVEMAADYVLRRVSLLAASCAGRTSSWTSILTAGSSGPSFSSLNFLSPSCPLSCNPCPALWPCS